MRILYIGMDNRSRVAKASSVKFLDDGFQATDSRDELGEGVDGPVVVAHLFRGKGGKRLVLSVPHNFNMRGAEMHLLGQGYLDLSDCKIQSETLY